MTPAERLVAKWPKISPPRLATVQHRLVRALYSIINILTYSKKMAIWPILVLLGVIARIRRWLDLATLAKNLATADQGSQNRSKIGPRAVPSRPETALRLAKPLPTTLHVEVPLLTQRSAHRVVDRRLARQREIVQVLIGRVGPIDSSAGLLHLLPRV